MEDKKEKATLGDNQLEYVSGGSEEADNKDGKNEVIIKAEDGTCPICGGVAYRFTKIGIIGASEERTWRACEVDGRISD